MTDTTWLIIAILAAIVGGALGLGVAALCIAASRSEQSPEQRDE